MSQHSATPSPNYKARTRIAVAVVILAMLGLGTGLFLIYKGSQNASHPNTSDSGVAACQEVANNIKNNKKSDDNDKPMSKDDLAKFRKPFDQSKYNDLKVAGTNLGELLYKMDNVSDDADFGEALGMLALLQNSWAQLQTACSAHGVDVPALPMGNEESKEPAAQPTI